MRLTVTLVLDVNVTDYAEAYGLDRVDARTDAADHLPDVVADGVILHLRALSNGATLATVNGRPIAT